MKLSRASSADTGRASGKGDGRAGDEGRILYIYSGSGVGTELIDIVRE